MKIKTDFITNSSSTCFVIMFKGELSLSQFIKAIGISSDSNFLDIYEELFNAIKSDLTPIDAFISKDKWNKDDKSIEKYNIKGFVISNIGYFDLLDEYTDKYELIGNYNLNVFNNQTTNNLNVNTITISPELNKEEINSIAINSNVPTEFIVYGNIPLMTSNYCLLGKANKCYPDCGQRCITKNKYYLKDRMNFLFRIIPDNIQTITTIYNSKISSIDPNEINTINNFRIDILDESIDEINNIINTVKQNNRLEGKEYTNGNLNRSI